VNDSLLTLGAASKHDSWSQVLEGGSVAVTHCLLHMLGLDLLSSQVACITTDDDLKQSVEGSSIAATGKTGLTIKEAAVKLQDILNGDSGVQQNACIAKGPLPGKMMCQLIALICNFTHIQGMGSIQGTPAINIVRQLELIQGVHTGLHMHARLL